MDNIVLNLLEDLNSELKLYKMGLLEIIVAENNKENAIEKLSVIKEDIVKYVMAGEVIYNITSNYVYLRQLLDIQGEVVGYEKCYSIKASEAIEKNENILSESTVEYEGYEYINLIKKELAKYKRNTIFTELQDVEEYLSRVNSSSNFFKEYIKELLDSIKEFNILGEASKMEELNNFCSENLENLKGSLRLMELRNEYSGANIIYDVNMFEYGGLFSVWYNKKLKPILNWNEEYYYRIINDLRFLIEAREAGYNIDLVKKQLKYIEGLKRYINSIKCN